MSFFKGLAQGAGQGLQINNQRQQLGLQRQALEQKQQQAQRARIDNQIKQTHDYILKGIESIKFMRQQGNNPPQEYLQGLNALVEQYDDLNAKVGNGAGLGRQLVAAALLTKSDAEIKREELEAENRSRLELEAAQQQAADANSIETATFQGEGGDIIQINPRTDRDRFNSLVSNPSYIQLNGAPGYSSLNKDPAKPNIFSVYNKNGGFAGQVDLSQPGWRDKALSIGGEGYSVFNATQQLGADAPSKADTDAAKKANTAYSEIQSKARIAIDSKPHMEMARRMVKSPDMFQGFGEAGINTIKKLGATVGLDVKGADLAAGFKSIANSLTLDKMSLLKGPASDRDVAIVQSVGPQLANTAEGNRFILEMMIASAERDILYSTIATEIKKANNGLFDEGEFTQRLHGLPGVFDGIRVPASIINEEEVMREFGFDDARDLHYTLETHDVTLSEFTRRMRKRRESK